MEASLPQLILSIKMERSEEGLASLGGLGVMEEMARALRVWQRVDLQLAGRGSGRGYRRSEFVQPLGWMLHAGGRRLEDLRAEQEVLANLGLGADEFCRSKPTRRSGCCSNRRASSARCCEPERKGKNQSRAGEVKDGGGVGRAGETDLKWRV